MDEPKIEPGARRDAKSASSNPLETITEATTGDTELGETPLGGEYTSI
jgi:hypothetical protein